MFSIATQFVMSRLNFSSLCWNLCRDIEKSVVTLFICVHLISVSQPSLLCRGQTSLPYVGIFVET